MTLQGRKMFSEWDLFLWDPFEDAALFGSRQWWFARQQGRFKDYYLLAN